MKNLLLTTFSTTAGIESPQAALVVNAMMPANKITEIIRHITSTPIPLRSDLGFDLFSYRWPALDVVEITPAPPALPEQPPILRSS
jgi:hypothetical protein